jgi:hypothetical protein
MSVAKTSAESGYMTGTWDTAEQCAQGAAGTRMINYHVNTNESDSVEASDSSTPFSHIRVRNAFNRVQATMSPKVG